MVALKNIYRGIGLELSNICNMQGICKHCDGAVGQYGAEQRFMPQETLSVIKREAFKFFSSITYSGGEVSCYPWLIKDLASSINLPFVLMTNGLKVIRGIKPTLVLVSLDPSDLRPGVDNDKIMENMLLYNCDLSVNTVLSAQVDIFELYQLLKKTQKKLRQRKRCVQEWKISFIVDNGLASQNKSIFPEWSEIFSQLAQFLPVYFKEVPFHLAVRGIFYTKNLLHFGNDNPQIDLNLNPCQYCFNRLYYTVINLEGNLQLCSIARNVTFQVGYSNTLKEALQRIDNCRELKEFTYTSWQECLKCRYFRICAGGCPGLAYIYTGEWTNRDVYQCEILKNTEQFLLPILPAKVKQIFTDGIDPSGEIY
jgi:radical SAM protein with 4Fe4S-binding SPASM domain